MALACAALHAQPAAPLALREHWAIQSSALVADTGDAISRPGYKTTGWYPATMPSTVVAALVKEHVYPDPGFGMNLRAFAGTSYPIGVNFSNIHMPPDSPYRVPWWFRTEFQAPPQHNEPKEQKGETLWLRFDGINYRANVWLNGKRIADSGSMAGAWRLFEFNVTEAIRPGAANALAVEV
jgi:exo-1,4-beta-D-glucosaminidase